MELKLAYEDDSSGEDCLRLLFDYTKQGGKIDVFEWLFIAEPAGHGTFVLDWSDDDYRELTKQFTQLNADLQEIASYSNRIRGDEALAAYLLPKRLLGVWRIYVKPLNTGGINVELLEDIDTRLNTMEDVKELKQRLAAGEALDFVEWTFLKENCYVRASRAEENMSNRYYKYSSADLKQRLSNTLYASYLILWSRRLHELYRLGAPDIICRVERQKLAVTLAINAFGREVPA